ncbi:MAG: 1-acyl-sn-glycerol-3-phosphate acyltransferase [Flavobacteriales bacterium]|nr:1-acyl-sn-glycerol-3-phosphate acyltransferase [Flavobacteriales bacterium]MCX7768411.1 1-acyl-sn-glycerol-3-phosphate acyltransferase [Flavobacteriales bacterium]MDW8409696.1 lysophospholipid acyltransferase family protein [Flavobacteriales bacterium]
MWRAHQESNKIAYKALKPRNRPGITDYLRTLWAWGIFGLYLVVMYPVVLFFSFVRKPLNSALFVQITRKWVKVILWLAGVRWKFINPQNLPRGSSYVIISNHTSLLDIFTAALAVEDNIKGLAKKEIGELPFLRFYFGLVSIFVDRSSSVSRQISLEKCAEALRSGHTLLIFPEGTRNRTEELLLPFRDGAFRIAIKAQCPIVPYVTPDNRFLMPMKDKILRRGCLRIIYLEPIFTNGLREEDVPLLRERVRDLMAQALREAGETGIQ